MTADHTRLLTQLARSIEVADATRCRRCGWSEQARPPIAPITGVLLVHPQSSVFGYSRFILPRTPKIRQVPGLEQVYSLNPLRRALGVLFGEIGNLFSKEAVFAWI